MAKPFLLLAADAISAARAAYKRGELSAQGPTPACKYRDDSGRPCAIGAALSPRMRAAWGLLKDASVYRLNYRGVLESDDMAALVRLQRAHDFWADNPHSGPAQNVFRAVIGLEPKGV